MGDNSAQSKRGIIGTLRNAIHILKPVLGYFLAVVSIWLIVPSSWQISDYQLDMRAGRILPGNVSTRPFRLTAKPSDFSAIKQLNPRQTGSRQFHFEFAEDWPTAGPRRIYIPSTASETRVYINGVPLGQNPNVNPYIAGLGGIFVQHDIPRWILVPGSNRLDIYVHEDDTRTGLREIYIGPNQEIGNVFKRHMIWARSIPIISAFGSALSILIAILGFIYGRAHKTYLFLGFVGCIILYNAGLSLTVPTAAIKPYALAVRYILPVLYLVVLSALFLTDNRKWMRLGGYRYAFYGLAFTGPVVALAAMLLPFLIPLPVVFATILMLGILPLLYVLGGQYLLSDLIERQSQLETLRKRVSEQEAELGERGQALARVMQNRAVLEERQRFTRDIHDGIGGQLLSLILKIRTGKLDQKEIVTELQAGLNDLRLVVDSIDHTGGDLTAALTTFRSRAESQVKAANLSLEWRQPAPLYQKFETTNGTLNIYRFLQEAFANIIRHADAQIIRVDIQQNSVDDPLIIKIQDDGIGFNPDEKTAVGKGLNHLQQRASLAGGMLEFTSGINGKGAGLELVIDPDTES